MRLNNSRNLSDSYEKIHLRCPLYAGKKRGRESDFHSISAFESQRMKLRRISDHPLSFAHKP